MKAWQTGKSDPVKDLARLIPVLIIFLVVMGWHHLHKTHLTEIIERQSVLFAIEAVNDITDHWTLDTLGKYADSALSSQSAIPTALAVYRNMGFRKGQAVCRIVNMDNSSIREKNRYYFVQYKCDVQLEKAPATVELTLYTPVDSGFWKIQYFYVTSPFFGTS